MSYYSNEDRGLGFKWFEDAVKLMFAILGTILTNFLRECKGTQRRKRKE